jgi:hypothetical protein
MRGCIVAAAEGRHDDAAKHGRVVAQRLLEV